MKSSLLLLVLLPACASNKVRPDDESAQAHRAEAAHEKSEAAAQRHQYDPTQDRQVGGGGRGDVDVPSSTYNPTDWHLHEADKLSAHARAHEAAAAALEKFEGEECRQFSPKVRAACPVAGPIVRIEDTAVGVRFVLADGAPTDAVVAHMRCHFAWARSRGFDQLPGCPIYIKGIAIKAATDGHSIEVTATDKATISDLQRRSHGEGGAS